MSCQGTWREQLSLENLKSKAGITSPDFDQELSLYISGLIDTASFYSYLDFNLTQDPTTSVFVYNLPNRFFVNNGKMLNIGFWQSISLVELGTIGSNVFDNWEEEKHFTFAYHRLHPNPIYRIDALCSHFTQGRKVRITGVKGFAKCVPESILSVFTVLLNKYYQYLADGSVFLSSERSISLAKEFNNNDVLQTSAIFAPETISAFINLFKIKYNAFLKHPLR